MKILKFILALLLSFAPGAIGMHWTSKGVGSGWYASLAHPILTPPNWMFSVVWTILYFLLAIAFYSVIVRRNKHETRLVAIELFITHIIFNAAWSYVFFGRHLVELGAVIIVALILIAFMMHQVFGKVDRQTGKFITPYIAWLFVALYLNLGIYFLN